jgi:hypothetical protein
MWETLLCANDKDHDTDKPYSMQGEGSALRTTSSTSMGTTIQLFLSGDQAL